MYSYSTINDLIIAIHCRKRMSMRFQKIFIQPNDFVSGQAIQKTLDDLIIFFAYQPKNDMDFRKNYEALLTKLNKNINNKNILTQLRGSQVIDYYYAMVPRIREMQQQILHFKNYQTIDINLYDLEQHWNDFKTDMKKEYSGYSPQQINNVIIDKLAKVAKLVQAKHKIMLLSKKQKMIEKEFYQKYNKIHGSVWHQNYVTLKHKQERFCVDNQNYFTKTKLYNVSKYFGNYDSVINEEWDRQIKEFQMNL